MPLVSGKKPSQLKDPTAAVDNSAWIVVELSNGEVVKIHPSSLPAAGGGATTTFNDETGGNAPASPTNPATVPVGANNGDTVVEFYDDQLLYWTFDGTNWTLNNSQPLVAGTDEYLNSAGLSGNDLVLTLLSGATVSVDLSSLAGGGGTSLSIYDAGTGFWVKGTTGITVTSGAAGVYDINIPAGGILESFQKEFSNAGSDFTVGGEVQFSINWNTAAFNTSFANAVLPNIKLIDSGGVHRDPGAVSVTVQTTSVSGGISSTTIANINGLGTPIRVKGIM